MDLRLFEKDDGSSELNWLERLIESMPLVLSLSIMIFFLSMFAMVACVVLF